MFSFPELIVSCPLVLDLIPEKSDEARGESPMTTSRETDNLNHPALRKLVDEADQLPLPDLLTLLKGLIPVVARELSPADFDAFIKELRLKGDRFYDATGHPGTGRANRTVIGERDLEGR